MDTKWPPFDIDSAILTNIMKVLQIKRIQFEQVVTLQDIASPPHAIVILHNSPKLKYNSQSKPIQTDQIYFCQQTMYNAPIPQAILTTLLNMDSVQLPAEYLNFKEFVKEIPYNARECMIDQLQAYKSAFVSYSSNTFTHNGNQNAYSCDSFITIMPIKGKVFEFNSSEKLPKIVGDYKSDWYVQISSILESIQNQCAMNGIAYHIIAVVEDKKEIAEEQLAKHKLMLVELKKRLGMKMESIIEVPVEIQKALPTEKDKIESLYKSVNEEIMKEEFTIASEEERRKLSQQEYHKRSYNYIPFVFNLLKALSEKGKLSEAIENAKKKMPHASS